MTNFDEIWEKEIYGQGKHLNKYPFDNVVSFVFRNYPRDKKREDIRILEVGCGAGNNLWFAAREGFQVFGIDGSSSAVDFCKKRFAEDNLKGDFRVGDFTDLSCYENDFFDIVIDRGSIVCCDLIAGKKAVSEVCRVLVKGGKFFFNPYSQFHSSCTHSTILENGYSTNIQAGTLVGVGNLCFYSYTDILKALPAQYWKIISIKHKEIREVTGNLNTHAEWEIIAEKI